MHRKDKNGYHIPFSNSVLLQNFFSYVTLTVILQSGKEIVIKNFEASSVVNRLWLVGAEDKYPDCGECVDIREPQASRLSLLRYSAQRFAHLSSLAMGPGPKSTGQTCNE